MIVARSSARTPRRRVVDLRRVDPAAAADQPVQVAGLDLPDLLQGGKLVLHAGQQQRVRRGLHHAGHRARVGEDPGHLIGAGGLVDRHGHRAGRPDGVVEQGPLVPGLAHQADPGAGLDPGRDQAAGHRQHLVAELPAGDLGPAVPLTHRRGVGRVPGTPGELHRVRGHLGVVPDRVGQVGRVADGRDGWYGELAHLHSFVLVLDAGGQPRGDGSGYRKPTRPSRSGTQAGRSSGTYQGRAGRLCRPVHRVACPPWRTPPSSRSSSARPRTGWRR